MRIRSGLKIRFDCAHSVIFAPYHISALLSYLNSLTKTIDAEVEGEMATLKETVNDMVQKLRVFSSEVTRVSLDVGTKGQLGGQAVVTGVEGTWKDCTWDSA